MNPARKRAYIELLILAIIWGAAGVVIKYTLFGFPPLIFLTYRFALATMAAVILFATSGFKLPQNKKTLGLIALNGFLITTVSLGLLFWGTEKTSAIDATLISAVAPIVIAIAGVIFLNEQITSREKLGIFIATIGTIITLIEPILNPKDGFSGVLGNSLVLASVIITAITAVLAKKIMRDNVDALLVTNFSFVIGFLTILPITLIFYSPLSVIHSIVTTPLSYHLGVFFMAFVSGILGYYLWHKAEKTIEIGEVNLVAYLYVVFGTPLAVFWLHEKITSAFIAGTIIIAIGVVIAEWKKRRYN